MQSILANIQSESLPHLVKSFRALNIIMIDLRHCDGALAFCPTLAPYASAVSNLQQSLRLLRREKRPPRNDVAA
jgi:hypothetical protein